MKVAFDLDQFNSANRADTARGTMALLDRAQTLTPAVQLGAAAALFLLIAEHRGVDPAEGFRQITNMMASQGKGDIEFAAARAYVKAQL